MTDEEIGHAIIGAAMRVHSVVGPGLLESAYETCLLYELENKPFPYADRSWSRSAMKI
jgi:GxxExxY protein